MSKHRCMIMEPHCAHRVCRSCGEQFKPAHRNQQTCEWCLDLSASNLQKLYRQACKAYKRIRIEAQCSGNACEGEGRVLNPLLLNFKPIIRPAVTWNENSWQFLQKVAANMLLTAS